ncbi:MAG: hypothetical protein ACXWUG_22950 [Polyangiales bacterium]
MLARWSSLGIALLTFACGKADRPPPPHSGFDFDASGDGGESTLDVSLDASINCSAAGVCACEEIGQKPTNLYLVVDRSGSMAEMATTTQTKWQTIVLALFDNPTGVIRGLGGRISLGLTLFPGASATDGCLPGDELLPPTPGSKLVSDNVTSSLIATMPNGATPTAATLRALAPRLKALPPPVYVLLATDGAPNCGTVPCTADRCSYNIEKVAGCDPSTNCCDPVVQPKGQGWAACVDSTATTAAVADLAAAGIKVFVLGIPGVGPYSSDLDALAVAGNTAREDAMPGEPLYYAAANSTQEAFATALKAVAAKVVDTCLITLESAPADPGITNVAIDGALVAQDPVDGWTWTSDGKIELHGKTCDQVKKGLVSAIQVAVGCKTITK